MYSCCSVVQDYYYLQGGCVKHGYLTEINSSSGSNHYHIGARHSKSLQNVCMCNIVTCHTQFKNRNLNSIQKIITAKIML